MNPLAWITRQDRTAFRIVSVPNDDNLCPLGSLQPKTNDTLYVHPMLIYIYIMMLHHRVVAGFAQHGRSRSTSRHTNPQVFDDPHKVPKMNGSLSQPRAQEFTYLLVVTSISERIISFISIFPFNRALRRQWRTSGQCTFKLMAADMVVYSANFFQPRIKIEA